MFAAGVWIVVAILVIFLLASMVRRGGRFSTNDLIGLLAIAVGVLVAIYANRLQLPAVDSPDAGATLSFPRANTEVLELPTQPMTTTAPHELPAVSGNTPTPLPTDTELVTKPEPVAAATSTPEPEASATNTTELVATAITMSEVTKAPSATPELPVPTSTFSVTTEAMRIIVEGVGAASDAVTNPVLRERAAYQAAEIDAKRKLAEWADGAEVESLAIVEQGTLITDTIRLLVKAKVPPSTVINRKYDPATGTAWVTLEALVSTNSSR